MRPQDTFDDRLHRGEEVILLGRDDSPLERQNFLDVPAGCFLENTTAYDAACEGGEDANDPRSERDESKSARRVGEERIRIEQPRAHQSNGPRQHRVVVLEQRGRTLLELMNGFGVQRSGLGGNVCNR